MISKLTLLNPIDTCGVWTVRTFHLYKGSWRRHSYNGDFVKVSVRRVKKRNWIKKKKKLISIIIRSNYRILKPDGTSIYFKSNSNVLLKKRLTPKGRFLKGPSLILMNRRKFQSSFPGTL